MNVSPENSVHLTRNTDTFSEQLYKHYVTQHLTDVTFRFPNAEPVRAHKIILSAYIPFFEETYCELSESKTTESEILLFDIPVDTVKSMLELMYKGEVEIKEASIPAFKKLLQHFKLSDILANSGIFSVDNGEDSTADELDISPNLLEKETRNNCHQENMESNSPKKLNPFAKMNKRLRLSETSINEDYLPLSERIETNLFVSATSTSINNSEMLHKTIEDSLIIVENSPEIINIEDSVGECLTSLPNNHFNQNNTANSSVAEPQIESAENDQMVSYSDKSMKWYLRKKKYDIKLKSSDFRYGNFHNFCVICNKFCLNFKEHLKNTHKPSIKSHNNICKKCKHTFFRAEYLKIHKCGKKVK